MKPHRIAWFLLCIIFRSYTAFASFSDQSGEKLKEINRTEPCRTHPVHTYQVFVPALDKLCKNLPLMIVIDPHGDGKLAIKHFKEVAQTYDLVLIASNLIRNNVSGYLQLIDELINDAKSKYPVGNTIYLGGFSGGARMALDFALNRKVGGVIACGALAEPDQVSATNCRIVSIVGMDDFNFIESARFIIHPESMPQNLDIMTTDASHSWPNPNQLNEAIGYLSLSSGEKNICFDANALVKSFVVEQTARLNSLSQSGDQMNAMLLARNLSLSRTFESLGSFRSRYDNLVKEDAFLKQRDNLITNLRFELSLRDQYSKSLQEKDSIWWKNEIKGLNSKITTEKDLQKKMVYHRIKGFLGVVCYSMCSRAAGQKDTAALDQIIPVYRSLEPDNPDQFYFSAVQAHLKKNLSMEKYCLEKAKEKGYQGSLSIP